MISAEWVTATATCLGTISLLLVWNQLKAARAQLKAHYEQLKADHERSRRERTIELMRMWCDLDKFLGPGGRAAWKIVQELEVPQCESVSEGNAMKIDERLSPHVEVLRASYPQYSGDQNETSNGKIALSDLDVKVIRSNVVTYLNHLETIATAWRHNIADREIIEEEFLRILSPQNHSSILEAYRKVSGVYPSIKELARAIDAKKERRDSKFPVA